MLMLIGVIAFSCISSDEDCCDNPESPNLVIKFKFDPNQIRLDNIGQPSTIPTGNAAQSPIVNRMSANYIEFSPDAFALLGEGEVIFRGEETTDGGDNAIDFRKAIFAGNNETFLTVPLSSISPGNYNWVRVSLAYQEGEIEFMLNGTDITGTIGSFVGYNTYITSFDLNNRTVDVNGNRLQGFWAFEAFGFSTQGQAPEGAVTVPNPLFETSPIPQGSCVVTGQFENGLTISGNETQDVIVTLSFSINNSFEWTEINTDGKFEPSAGETLVDMGLRGLIPYVGN